MSRLRKVLVFLNRINVYESQFFDGVALYAAERGAWQIFTQDGMIGFPMRQIRKWRGGVVGFIRNKDDILSFWRSKTQAVNVCRYPPDDRLPAVRHDLRGGGEMAADYFLQRGFQSFGFCGKYDGPPSAIKEDPLQAGFFERLSRDGFDSKLFDLIRPNADGEEWRNYLSRLTAWLRGLPKPAAILAISDMAASSILTAARIARVRVPHDVAVMGWGNNEVICRHTDPPVTSMDSSYETIGYEAAALLDRLMDGRERPSGPILVPSKGIIERQSSDTVVANDPFVASALRYIHLHACESIGVPDVVAQLPIKRRQFEDRFREAMGRAPNSEIMRIRLIRAKDLLSGTNLPVNQVAIECGYASHISLDAVFVREMGMTPLAFRKQSRQAKSDSARLLPARIFRRSGSRSRKDSSRQDK
jgi:LacI family transcriptional regulator